MDASINLGVGDTTLQILDPDGTARSVYLPAEAGWRTVEHSIFIMRETMRQTL